MATWRSASPKPRRRELPYRPFGFPIVSARRLPRPTISSRTSALDVIGSRRSSRTFRSPLSEGQLSALLWHSCRTIEARREHSGFEWQHRPAPSAGGRHPVHLLVLGGTFGDVPVELYVPEDHRLAVLDCSEVRARRLRALAARVLGSHDATLIWLAAEVGRTTTKYLNAESLIWRDAGTLLAVLSIVASTMKLNSCALGPTGEPEVSRLLESRGSVMGLGGFAVGVS